MKHKRRPISPPPLVHRLPNGKLTWKSVGSIDYELLGYFLACHLVFENYLTYCLKLHYDLDWDSAKLNFGMKVHLLGDFIKDPELKKKYDLMPSLKYFNKLRNTIGHSAPFNLSVDDMKPLMAVLDRIGCNYDKTDIRDILDVYVGIVGAFLAGTINQKAQHAGEWDGTPPPSHPIVPPRPPVSDGTGGLDD